MAYSRIMDDKRHWEVSESHSDYEQHFADPVEVLLPTELEWADLESGNLE